MGWGLLLVLLAAPGLMLLSSRSVDAQPVVFRTVIVNCGTPGQTITNALRRQVVGGGLLVLVSGTCNEHVDVFRDDVILRGNPTATINGPTTTDDTIGMDHVRRVSLESLTITGGRNGVAVFGSSVTMHNVTIQGAAVIGVSVSYGGHAFIDGSTVKQNGSVGVSAANTSTAVVTNTTVEQNASTGLQAVRASHLRVGQDFQGGSTVGPVIVRGNSGNGITINDSSAGIIIGSTIQNNVSNGMYIARGSHADVGIGSFNVVSANAIKDNGAGSSGILIEGASANIVGNTISGNGLGVQFLNGGNGRLGVRPDSTAYIGNTITNNKLVGLQLGTGSTAVIGGNTIGGNNTAGGVGGRFGVIVSQSAANFIGQNIIENHPESGVFVRQGSLLMGLGFASLDTSGNVIRNNGCASEAGSNRSGVLMFEGATGEIRATTITQNCGSNVQTTLGGLLDLRGAFLGNPSTLVPTTISLAQVPPGGSPASTPGINIGTRGYVRLITGTVVDSNPGDGVTLINGATLEVGSNNAVSIINNGTPAVTTNGFPINCLNGTETSVSVPITGAVPIFTGNVAGNIVNNCTGF